MPPGFWVCQIFNFIAVVTLVFGAVAIMLMLSTSLSVIKDQQNKRGNANPYIINLQILMTALMIAAFAIIYLTVFITSIVDIALPGINQSDGTEIAIQVSLIITMPLVTAGILLCLHSLNVYSICPFLEKARVQDHVNYRISQRRNTLDTQIKSSVNNSYIEEDDNSKASILLLEID